MVKLDVNKILIFDGAMGSLLQSEGMKAGELPESYNIKAPGVISKIHKAYLNAGADIILTNTFGAGKYKLQGSGLTVNEVVKSAVEIAKTAAKEVSKKTGEEKYVALDIGPLGGLLEPNGDITFEDAYEAFAEQIISGTNAGADLILIETMSDIYEAKAAILAAKENSNLPVICTMTFQKDGRTLTGTDPITMVNVLGSLGIDALGINCSLGPKEMLSILEEILKYSQIPVIVQPNAGLPKLLDGQTIYDVGAEEFSKYILKMVQMGVNMAGGCCGTTPDHICEMKRLLAGFIPRFKMSKKITAVSSSTTTEILDDKVRIIGERINPTGKKLFKQALINRDMDFILKEALNQKKAGAHILDVNVGLPEIDEKAVMIKAVKKIQSTVNIPLVIDSSRPDVLEAAARICNGRPIFNSVNGEDSVMEVIFPIAKKYGCLLIALTLDEKGIPKTARQRLQIAEKIINKAAEYGIDKEDIIVDCLVLTASAQQGEVQETIKALSLVKEKLNVKTTLGISNVSFGLPARGILNRTFLAMALTAGLNAPIINPLEEDMMNTIKSFNVLWNLDEDSREYISKFADYKPEKTVNNYKSKDLQKIIIDGIKDEAAALTSNLLNHKKPLEIVDEYLIPALDIVGEKYEKGDIFLPQLIQSAETVKRAFEVIKGNMLETGQIDSNMGKGKIVIATVKGDIHDIGKNIVKILLENYGFEVHDLGKDVSIDEIVEKVKKTDAPLVGLSALMTTTVRNMEETIKVLKEKCPGCKVMVGGAVLNKDYAQMIKADYYGADAREAVKLAQNFFAK
ncbi:MAG: homocysteine S-methyltransferase family protein [Firmicutes bacterium]|nr:homocysteine S-methyltransferase family protein [Bacillota bacterium]